MTNVIPADIEINPSIVHKIINEQFGIRAADIRLLGEGFDNAVYLVDDSIVFRFPRRAEAVNLIEREIAFLPLLADHVGVAIPTPTHIGRPSETFQRPFYGHPLLKGQSGSAINLSRDEYFDLAIQLAEFLRRLHAINPLDLGLSTQDSEPLHDRTDFKKIYGFFVNRLNQIEKIYSLDTYKEKFDEICDGAKDYQSRTHVGFIHGDLYHRHLIFDDLHRLYGVIDWGDSALSDQTADLSVVFQFLPQFVHETFFKFYGDVTTAELKYAKFLGLYYAVALLWFGNDRKDEDLIKTSLRTIREI